MGDRQITHGFVGVQRAPTEHRVGNHEREAALRRERLAEGIQTRAKLSLPSLHRRLETNTGEPAASADLVRLERRLIHTQPTQAQLVMSEIIVTAWVRRRT